MLNFTVGPVMSEECIREIGKEQIPYFRTDEFSKLMYENERLILDFFKAPSGSRAVYITGSGTASMEAAIINTLTGEDKILVVNGGSFGQRFVDLLELYEYDYTEVIVEFGKAVTKERLLEYENSGYTAFVINMHETSTGVLYDMEMISSFCKRNNLFLIVDAISSFLADPFDMTKLEVDVVITGSQKALACPPGISVIAMSQEAIERVNSNKVKCMYLNLKNALDNGERGQTPFTPAVGILRQINVRLKEIERAGGVENETKKIEHLAKDFREKIKGLPFEMVSDSMSNAVTSLHPTTASANNIFLTLKNEYNIWICPNGGELKDKVFRVGHIGDLSIEDNDTLIAAFRDMQNRGLL